MHLTASVLLLLIGFMQCCACDSCQFKQCAFGIRVFFSLVIKWFQSSAVIYYLFLLIFCTSAIHQSSAVLSCCVRLSVSCSYPLYPRDLIPVSIIPSTSLSLGLVAAGGCRRSVTRCQSCQSVCACACIRMCVC